MFDSVMFETVRRARVDCFMNTPLQQLGWVATWNLHNELLYLVNMMRTNPFTTSVHFA